MHINLSFLKVFQPRFEAMSVWKGCEFLCEKMSSIQFPYIVQTGQANCPESEMFEWVIRNGGSFSSCCDNDKLVTQAKSALPRGYFFVMDGIEMMTHWRKDGHKIDLLHLNSYDSVSPIMCAMQAAGKLAAIYSKLKTGCLISVPKAHSSMINAFMVSIKARPIHSSDIIVWQKP